MKEIECPFCDGTGIQEVSEKRKYRIRLKKGSHRIVLRPEKKELKKKINKDGDVIAEIEEVVEKAYAPMFDKAFIEDPPGSGVRKPRLYVLSIEELNKILTEFKQRGIEYEGYVEEKLPNLRTPLEKIKPKQSKEKLEKK